MQYLGGKFRTAKQIAAYLEDKRENLPFIEPFCGGLWITQEMTGKRAASDGNLALITLYEYLQKGWIPPSEVSEETYQKYKHCQDPYDPMTAFIAFGCSFGGKWFGGYARDPRSTKNYAQKAKNSLLKTIPKCANVLFRCADYREILHGVKEKSLIYLDPPYDKTTGYGALGDFDSSAFWTVTKEISQTHLVYVSEYQAPSDFVCVLEMPIKTGLGGKNKLPRIEKLFTWIRK